jgi:5-(carboxyamino)imidazole ribonucleotide synthase
VTDPVTGLPVVGMVGAGQLARMTHQAVIPLGLSLRILADSPTDGAALIATDVEVGPYVDLDVLMRFAKGCDVVTFDHEHVPTHHLQALEASGVVVRPGSAALVHAQDKLVMRRRLQELGLPVPPFAEVTSYDDVRAFGDVHGWPVVVKATRGGYDGRGVWLLDRGDDLPPAPHLLVEERVPIVREVAVQVARRPSGEMRGWPVVETVQSDGICVEVVSPATALRPELAVEAERIGETIARELDVTGVLAVELFETADGLVVNELAMRPHNSGHWSIEGAVTSQFEQHVRAVLDWPLGDTSPRAPVTVMANLLGGERTDLTAALPALLAEDRGVHVHLYGKGVRPGRKLGHVTVLGDDVDATRARAQRAVALLRGDAS